MSDIGKAMWDAREDYCKKLEEIDNNINAVKARVEMKDDPLLNLKIYFSGLRILYRKLRPFMTPAKKTDKNEAEEWDKKIKIWVAKINKIEKVNQTNTSKMYFDWELVDELEGFHIMLSQLRFDNNLVVPRQSEEDEGFI